ncbi:ComEC/Rec2 family competence protein [Flagellimonas onchidii]|uniref:ComEC/Rec2 family competence protein n=1 Tax=Flagellimonas onchidii TaxID=2562684 RepID=UPI0010A5EC55|nr:ComEC/Rec2 family competence protein [Allomuricauda onchidii]
MRFFDFVSIRLTLCLVVGIILGFYLEINPHISFFAIIGLLPFLYWSNKKQARKGFLYFELTTILISVLLGTFVVQLRLSNNYLLNDLKGSKLWEIKITEVLKSNPYNQRYIAQILSFEKTESCGKILISIPNDSISVRLKVDDELFVNAPSEVVKPPLNPHQFNYKAFLGKQGIHHQIRVAFEQILLKKNPDRTLLGIASALRTKIISSLKSRGFGEEELGVIQALLLGQREDISNDTYNDYKDAGAIHILAVSGLHVGILLLLFQFILSPLERLPKGKTLKLIGVVLLLWGYAFIAGLSPSIVRAVTMFNFVAYAMYLNRPTNSFNIVALSMFFILLVKPLFLFQVGFQMSYAAVFSIVWIYPKLQRFWFPNNIFIRKAWQLLSVSVAAQLGVLPISLFYFHQFPALFFISNLIVIPFLGIILGKGILIIVLSLIDLLPNFLVDSYNFIIKTMNTVISWIAKQEDFVIRDIPFDVFQLLFMYVTIIGGALFLSKPKWKNTLVLMLSIIVLQAWGIWKQSQLKQQEVLIVAHKNRNTLLLYQKADTLNLYTADNIKTNRIAKDFAVAEGIDQILDYPLTHGFYINNRHLYIMDSLAIYPPKKHVDFLLLTQSPKINLERLIDSIKPKLILADGSNYKSYVEQWKQTCLKKEIPFHDTNEKGFYVFDLD